VAELGQIVKGTPVGNTGFRRDGETVSDRHSWLTPTKSRSKAD
jgi:hypothetical protein